ncbi:P-loop NTPase family protein [Mycobacteroides abscessus]|uniref:hypothetical protein n=1 Tax=Mycobacteroides abscessus TaxID=36809 RepID=UPI002E13BF50
MTTSAPFQMPGRQTVDHQKDQRRQRLGRQVADRESAGTIMQIRTAHFLQVKTLEDFNLNHLPSLRRDVLAHLATGTFRTVWKRCRANRI